MSTVMPMMECGHVAQSMSKDGAATCVICVGIHAGARKVAETPPDLTGRVARCSCGREEPSSPRLAFFEYLGPGSRWAEDKCANCSYVEQAHTYGGRYAPRGNGTPSAMNMQLCLNRGHDAFVPAGGVEHDRYYCGCRGWD